LRIGEKLRKVILSFSYVLLCLIWISILGWTIYAETFLTVDPLYAGLGYLIIGTPVLLLLISLIIWLFIKRKAFKIQLFISSIVIFAGLILVPVLSTAYYFLFDSDASGGFLHFLEEAFLDMGLLTIIPSPISIIVNLLQYSALYALYCSYKNKYTV